MTYWLKVQSHNAIFHPIFLFDSVLFKILQHDWKVDYISDILPSFNQPFGEIETSQWLFPVHQFMKYRLGFNNGNSIVKSYGVSTSTDSNRLTLCDRTVRSNASNLNVWSALLYMYLYCTLPFSCHTGVQTINECHCSLRPGH